MKLSGKSNINPKIWGPYFWETFHFVAFGYPENPNEHDKEEYKKFYSSFMKILPCDKCTNSSQELFKKSSIDYFLKSRQTLIKWTHDFHKKVNDKLGRDSPGFEEFVSNFKNRNEGTSLNTRKWIYTILSILIPLLILLGIMRYTLNNPCLG